MSTSNNGIYNTVGASISGVTNTLTVTNPSNTASSAARETITVGGGTAADPTINWNVSGVTDWEMGIDNSDSDKWKLAQGTALGTNDTITAFTGGQVLKPRQPAFFAYTTANILNVTGDSTVYQVVYDSELFDVGSNFNTATGVFTAPVTGIYALTYSVWCLGLSASYTIGVMYAQRTGSATSLFWGKSQSFASVRDTNIPPSAIFDGSNIVQLTANDQVSIQLRLNGGTKTIIVAGEVQGGAGSYPSFFSGTLLG